MNFVCIVFELGDKMLTLSSMENLIVPCNLKTKSPQIREMAYQSLVRPQLEYASAVWDPILMY